MTDQRSHTDNDRQTDQAATGADIHPDDLTAAELRAVKQEAAKSEIIKGVLVAVLGAAITGGTYLFAEQLGNQYFVFWGLIVIGAVMVAKGVWEYTRA